MENQTVFSLTNTTENFTSGIVASTTGNGTAVDCGKYDLIMNSWVKFVLIGLGSVGNTLSVWVMWSERKKSATAFLLIVLAVVDTLLMYTWTFLVTTPGKMLFSCFHTWDAF